MGNGEGMRENKRYGRMRERGKMEKDNGRRLEEKVRRALGKYKVQSPALKTLT